MIDYVYKAKDLTSGQIITAGVKADSPESAAKVLAKQNLFAIDIQEKSDGGILSRVGLKGRVTSKERVLFTRQLSTLINAGLPLARALRTVQDQIKGQTLNNIIGEVVAAVEGGSSLSNAFGVHPKVFNEIYVALVAAGETSGTLDKALLRLANQQEKDAEIITKIRGALIYPAIVLVLIVVVVGIMLVSVVPQVSKLYKDLGKSLPFLTQLLVSTSDFLIHFWWLAILGLVAAAYGAKILYARESTKLELDRLKLKAPLFGAIFAKVYMARFSRTMNTLIASGIPMLDALATVKRAINNRVVEADLEKAISQVRGGTALSESLGDKTSFLVLVPQMVKIGEESGALDDMLDRTALYYEAEVDEAIKNISTTIEPVMMVVLGVIVAFVLGAILYPIYSLVGNGGASNIK